MLIHNKDDIEFVTEFPCFLGHPVPSIPPIIHILTISPILPIRPNLPIPTILPIPPILLTFSILHISSMS